MPIGSYYRTCKSTYDILVYPSFPFIPLIVTTGSSLIAPGFRDCFSEPAAKIAAMNSDLTPPTRGVKDARPTRAARLLSCFVVLSVKFFNLPRTFRATEQCMHFSLLLLLLLRRLPSFCSYCLDICVAHTNTVANIQENRLYSPICWTRSADPQTASHSTCRIARAWSATRTHRSLSRTLLKLLACRRP